MNTNMKTWRYAVAVMGIFVGLTLVRGQTASAASPDNEPDVVAPREKAFPMTYGEWSARWWQYVFGLPADDHPLTDPTGEQCAVGQFGPVFFLVGTTGGAANRIACEVPTGKGLLFPIINAACAIPEDGSTTEQIRNLCSAFIDGVDLDTLAVEVDGVALQGLEKFRFKSPIFSFTGNTPNVFSEIGCSTPPCYQGFREKAFADGFWILLEPLAVGKHSIHFHGEIPGSLEVDVTYALTVIEPSKERSR